MRLVQVPEKKSSATTTAWPSATNFFANADPMKPAPPVTRIRMFDCSLRQYDASSYDTIGQSDPAAPARAMGGLAGRRHLTIVRRLGLIAIPQPTRKNFAPRLRHPWHTGCSPPLTSAVGSIRLPTFDILIFSPLGKSRTPTHGPLSPARLAALCPRAAFFIRRSGGSILAAGRTAELAPSGCR